MARATGKSNQELESLVSCLTEPPTFDVLGQINVVLLNMELKKLP